MLQKELRDYIQKLLPDKRVVCIPDRVDLEEHTTVKREHSEKLKSLAWFGYSHNYVYIDRIMQSSQAKRLFKEHGLSLTIFSESQIEPEDSYKDLDFTWRKYDYKTIHDDLVAYDAAFFPPDRDKTNYKGRFKSDNKLITCKALGLPIVQKPEDIEGLMSEKERVKIGKEGRREVEKDYDVRISVDEYKQLIKEINGKDRSADKVN